MHDLLCKLKFKIEDCKFGGKFVAISFFYTLFLIILLFEAANTCFLQISVKAAVVLGKIKFLKNPIRRPRVADML